MSTLVPVAMMLTGDEILRRIERLLVEPRIDSMRDRDDEQRVAVGSGFGREVGADNAAGARAVVDKNLLAKLFAELIGDDPPDHVVTAAGRERNDQPDRPARIIVRGNGSGERDQRRQETRKADSRCAKFYHVRPQAVL